MSPKKEMMICFLNFKVGFKIWINSYIKIGLMEKKSLTYRIMAKYKEIIILKEHTKSAMKS